MYDWRSEAEYSISAKIPIPRHEWRMKGNRPTFKTNSITQLILLCFLTFFKNKVNLVENDDIIISSVLL